MMTHPNGVREAEAIRARRPRASIDALCEDCAEHILRVSAPDVAPDVRRQGRLAALRVLDRIQCHATEDRASGITAVREARSREQVLTWGVWLGAIMGCAIGLIIGWRVLP